MLIKLARAVASGFGFGGLDEAIEAFQNPVGDLALEPAEHINARRQVRPGPMR